MPRWLVSGLMLFVLDTVPAVAGAPDSGRPGSGTITVFAAASLRDVFSELGAVFEKEHPGVKAQFNFAGSQELRTQIEQGAPADVFAAADTSHMDAAHRAGMVDAPELFATNDPVIVVPADNPGKVESLADLATVKRLVIGASQVPIGIYTLQILQKARAQFGEDFPARVQARVVSRELSVRQVLAKVALGEADAAIVYRTDARSSGGKVRIVEIPPELNVVALYPIATVSRAPNAGLARAWVGLVTGPAGQAALEDAGFGGASRALPRLRQLQNPEVKDVVAR
jgi:molybdate transport system substrate-binding protein